MTTTEATTEEALWLYIGEMPECGHRRQYAADWFEDRASKVECGRCKGHGEGYDPLIPDSLPVGWKCPTCTGTGYIPDRNGRLAAALRATADRVPRIAYDKSSKIIWYFYGNSDTEILKRDSWAIPMAVRVKLSDWPNHKPQFPTAAAAIRDLCEAWCKVNYGEVRE